MKKISFLILLLLFLSCTNNTILTKDKIELIIDQNLFSNSSKNEIETFMSVQGWLYSFDEYSSRYQARTKDGKSRCKFRNPFLSLLYECGIQIYIYTDENGYYLKREVEEVYSGL